MGGASRLWSRWSPATECSPDGVKPFPSKGFTQGCPLSQFLFINTGGECALKSVVGTCPKVSGGESALEPQEEASTLGPLETSTQRQEPHETSAQRQEPQEASAQGNQGPQVEMSVRGRQEPQGEMSARGRQGLQAETSAQ